MRDYINREAVTEAVWEILNGLGYSQKHNDRLVEEVDAVIDDIPAADVRPVVTCGECIYFRLNSCMRWADGTFMERTDFCSRAAKREES